MDESTTEALQSVVSRYASFDETTGRHKLAGDVGRYGEFAVYREEMRATRKTGAERMNMDEESTRIYEQTVYYYAMLKQTERAIAFAKESHSVATHPAEADAAETMLLDAVGRYDQVASECAQRAEMLMMMGHGEIQVEDFSPFSPSSQATPQVPPTTRVPRERTKGSGDPRALHPAY